jgi:DNA-binding MarR family transcriptional regulator
MQARPDRRKAAKITSVTPPGTSTLLHRLAKKITRSVPEEQLGMRLRQFWVLSFLSDRDGVPQHELGEVFMLDANNVVLLLNDLETAGWVERRRDPSDRRRHVVYMTDDGRTAFARSERARDAAESEVLAALAPEERDTLRRLLLKALDAKVAEPERPAA